MIITESLLLTVLLCTCAYVTYTDFKTGLIPNKALIISAAIVIVLDILYYSFFRSDLIVGFLLNFFVNMLISVLLYSYSFWGAGDSKLMILAGLSIPARFYMSDMFNIPLLTLPVQTFAIAFVYLMAESIFLGIAHKNLFQIKKRNKPAFGINTIKSYLLSYVYILLFSFIIRFTTGNYLEKNSYIIPLCNFFIVFTILNFNFFQKKYIVLSVLAADVILIILHRNALPSFVPPIWNLLIIAVVMLFRNLAEKYNYKIIKTSSVTPGIILSFETVINFKASRIKGLPIATTEDFRSKISDSEAEAIKRWENSQTGSHEITIVRKLPFAIFITIGILIFLVLRMWIN